jgi:hypothetical protein
MSEEWKVVPGYYPGFLDIVGASFKVSVVTDAIDLTLDDHIARVRDTHIMAAGKDLLEALELMVNDSNGRGLSQEECDEQDAILAKARSAIDKARGHV